jgi:hypothetical protein
MSADIDKNLPEPQPHNYSAEKLFYTMQSVGGEVKIELNNRPFVVNAMYGDLADQLFLGDKKIGGHLCLELEKGGRLNSELFYYFTVSQNSNPDSTDEVFYIDRQEYDLLRRYDIGHPYRLMPDKVYDSIFEEVCKLGKTF